MKDLTKLLLIFGFVAASAIAPTTHATVYEINHSFVDSDVDALATLTGTLEIPVGSYTIQNSSASPFTDVNLTLTVHGTSFHFVHAFTGFIYGSAQFFIDASLTTLTFSVANVDGSNPADLVFSDVTQPQYANRYAIGYDGSPGFELAHTSAGFAISAPVTFPRAFGTAVPEPTTLLLLGVAFVGFLAAIRRRKQSVASSDK